MNWQNIKQAFHTSSFPKWLCISSYRLELIWNKNKTISNFINTNSRGILSDLVWCACIENCNIMLILDNKIVCNIYIYTHTHTHRHAHTPTHTYAFTYTYTDTDTYILTRFIGYPPDQPLAPLLKTLINFPAWISNRIPRKVRDEIIQSKTNRQRLHRCRLGMNE